MEKTETAETTEPMKTADMAEAMKRVHKAAPAADQRHCQICGATVKRVPGGDGSTWVHADSGAVAAPNPPKTVRVAAPSPPEPTR